MRTKPLHFFPVIGVALLVASCGASSSTASNSSTVSRLISKSQNAVQSAGSVHFVDITQIGKTDKTITGDIGPTAAQEVLTESGVPTLQVRFVSNTVYLLTTSTSVLQFTLQLAPAAAQVQTNKWISLTPSDKPYATITQSLSITSALSIYYPTSTTTAKIGATRTVRGIKVVPITGTSSPQKNVSAETTVFIAAATSLPAAGALSAKTNSTTESKQGVFRSWGVPVSVEAPAGSTPYSSLIH